MNRKVRVDVVDIMTFENGAMLKLMEIIGKALHWLELHLAYWNMIAVVESQISQPHQFFPVVSSLQ